MLTKATALVTIFVVWLGIVSCVSYFAYKAFSAIRQISNVEPKAPWLAVMKVIRDKIPNPFATLTEGVRERAELVVMIKELEGYTFVPQGGEVISSQFLADRKQYSLSVGNESQSAFHDINLRLQLPYPLEDFKVFRTLNARDTNFSPIGTSMTFRGSGSVHVFRKPLSRAYQLRINELNPRGTVEILFLLNSWRDPRGKSIPKEEAVLYFVPESGPNVTYVHGTFSIQVGDETVTKEYYAPIILGGDKTIVLGPSGLRPETMEEIIAGFE
jgi:hypothetical protein